MVSSVGSGRLKLKDLAVTEINKQTTILSFSIYIQKPKMKLYISISFQI